ncbi:hypothetical protein AB0G02_34120, partial [Actinosynnema sp. NPDC023658]|uniref:hypothetical protein n=1 Tax=Actinosynnema sp. NPDC023658 TaxID=3155465 RepID=UPI0033D25CCC
MTEDKPTSPDLDDATIARVRYAVDLMGRHAAAPIVDVAGLAHAQSLWERVLADLPDHPFRPEFLGNLSTTLYERHRVEGGQSSLRRAIAVRREALDLAPADDPDRCVHAIALALMLTRGSVGARGQADLDEAVGLVRAAAPQAVRHPAFPDLAVNIAIVLLDHPEPDVAEVDRLTGAALAVARAGHPAIARLRVSRGRLHLDRYRNSGSSAELDAAITEAEHAVAAAPS